MGRLTLGAPVPSGIGPRRLTPLSRDHERATSARCYLTAEARARPNPEIPCKTRVLRILFDGRRVTGILAERAGAQKAIAAREVVISAGGIHSPAVLLRSGVGPAEDLRRLGIAVVADRRRVGRNSQNHPQLHFAMPLKAGTRMPAPAQHYIMTGHRFLSGLRAAAAAIFFTIIPAGSARDPSARAWRCWLLASTARSRAVRWRFARPIRRWSSNACLPIRSMPNA